MSRVAVVFGAARGIGAACAAVAAGAYDVVVCADLPGASWDEVTSAVAARGAEPVTVACDVRHPEEVARAVEVAVAHGDLLGAVNCAAVGGPHVPLDDYSLEDWNSVLDVGLTGLFLCLREELRAAAHGASIVNISSVLGHAAHPLAPAYTAVKHAAEGLTKSTALGCADRGIRVNSVAPGFILTDLLRERRSESERDVLAARHPAGRLGSPEEVAAVVAFLLSDSAGFVTGSCYRVDGGYLTRD